MADKIKAYTDGSKKKEDIEVSLTGIKKEGVICNMKILQQVWLLDGQIKNLGEDTPAGLMLRQALQMVETYFNVINEDDEEMRGQAHWATKIINAFSKDLLNHAEQSKKEVKAKYIIELLKKYKEVMELKESNTEALKGIKMNDEWVGEDDLFST